MCLHTNGCQLHGHDPRVPLGLHLHETGSPAFSSLSSCAFCLPPLSSGKPTGRLDSSSGRIACQVTVHVSN